MYITACRGAYSGSTGASPSILLTHGAVKIRPEVALPKEAIAIDGISAGRNEYESFQVIVSDTFDVVVTGISVQFPGLLSNETVLVHRQHYINISVVSNCAGDVGLWPDALIPDVDVYDHQKRNAFPVTINAGFKQAFFVDVFINTGANPGTHNGTVTITFGGESKASLPFSITVRNFTLPSISRYATTYNCRPASILSGRFLKNIPENITGAERVAWQKQYVDLGLMHRVTFSDFLDADLDMLGANDNSDDIDWTNVENVWEEYLGSNGLTVDTPFGLRETRPTTIQLPAVHYPGPPASLPNSTVNKTLIDMLWHATGCPNPTPQWGYAYWGNSNGCGTADMLQYCLHSQEGKYDPWSRTCAPNGTKVHCTQQAAPPDACHTVSNNTMAIAYWRDVADHARQNGWFDRVFDYTCDEPGAGAGRYPICKARAETIHAADKDYKVMITAEKPSADSVNISSMIDIWVPIINFMDSPTLCNYPAWAQGDRRMQDYQPLVDEGRGLWWYQSCMSEGCASAVQPAHGSSAPGCDPEITCTNGISQNSTWPSYMIDAPATFNRVMSWMSFSYQIEGELYWGSNAADSVYVDISNSSWETQWLAGGNGDGSLTYPGRPDHIGGESTIPIASLRLKQIRDGLEDLEYMYLLTDAIGNREDAEQIVAQIVKSTYSFEWNPLKFLQARSQLADAIEKALQSSK